MTHDRRLLLALFLCLFALPLAALDLPAEKERWITLRADEFQIVSNASEGATAAVAKQLVEMRDAIGKVTQLKVRSPLPTRVYIFRDERNFAPWRDAAMGQKSPTITGLFLGSDSGNVILIRGDAPGGVDRVVFHELTHYFVSNTVASLPLWVNEGLAEYYSTFAMSGNDVHVGKAVPEHVVWLRDQTLIPLRELFATDEQSPNYNEGTRAGAFYAESWALVHYLMLGNKQRHEQLGKFLGLVNAHQPLDDAFRIAFATTYEDLERELRGYVRKPTFEYIRFSGAELHAAELPKPSAMTRAEVLAQLGHLLAWSATSARPEAERFLNAAIAADPNLAGAYADLGRLQAIGNRTAEAAKSFERATALGSNDANVYLYYGDSLLRPLFDAQGMKIDREAIAKVRAIFTKTTELDPKSARAWAGLGATYFLAHDWSAPGIAALEKSLALSPAQPDVAFNLLQLYAHAGRREEAKQLFDSTLAHGDPEHLAQARDTLLQMDLMQVSALLNAEKDDEAIALAKELLPRATTAQAREFLTQIIAFGSQKKQHDSFAGMKDAVDLANAGKYAEAIALVDQILPSLTDPKLIAETKKFRAGIVEQAARHSTAKKKAH
jgi:tetratricopeptide (TPR) repeat protein